MSSEKSKNRELEKMGNPGVRMSTFAPAPILYRREHNLLDFDERMSVPAQKVAGRRFGDCFFPFAGGVAFSFNAYGWTARIRKEEGLIRLIFGMGTRAVDRVGADYTERATSLPVATGPRLQPVPGLYGPLKQEIKS